MDQEHLELDGSILEGGGQILRMSVALAALLKNRKSIKINKIRAGRTKPGLKAQHLTGIQLVATMTRAHVSGCAIDSSSVTFEKAESDEGHSKSKFSMDTKTAGATTLLAQIALPVALFRVPPKISLDLRGGTNADFAPTVDFYSKVFKPNLERFGASFDLDLKCRGYFPKGGGVIELNVPTLAEGSTLNAIEVTDPGEVKLITIEASVAGSLPPRLAEEMAEAARETIGRKYGGKVKISTKKLDRHEANGNGGSILVVAETTSGCTIGGQSISGPKKQPSKVGREAAEVVLKALDQKVCFDEFTQDQIIIFMALAKGKSKVLVGPLTLHTKTAIHVAEKMTSTAVFTVTEVENGNVLLECFGIGLSK